MDRLHHHHHPQTSHSKKDISLNSAQSQTSNSSKKWSFGRLFRKKKDLETESSSEEDRKAGFVPAQKYTRAGAGGGGIHSNNAVNSKSKPTKNKSNRSSKLIGAGFDHIVVNPTQAISTKRQHVANEFFLPVETVPTSNEPYYQNQQHPQQHLQNPQAQLYTRSSNSLDRRAARSANKSRSTQRLPHEPGLPHSSSEEEIISLNSSTFSKYRSDESIHSGGIGSQGNNGQSRRSRAARNERYYKRLSRDGEVSHGQAPVVMYAPQPAIRWKTQPVPLSIYNGPTPPQQTHAVRHQTQQVLKPPSSSMAAVTSQRLRNTGSLQQIAPYVQWGQMQQQSKNLQNSMNDGKRSISYDSHIHLQNINGRMQTKPLPPPPPPRDPMRRVNVTGAHVQNGSTSDLRPISYAFDQSGAPLQPKGGLNGRCVSDDKIWAAQTPHYQSAHSLNLPSSQHQNQHQQQVLPPSSAHSRRFITRAERDANPAKKSLPNGIDFHYVADATPRSRKPIHMLEQQCATGDLPTEPPSSGILRTTKSGLPSPQTASDFWKRLDHGSHRRGHGVERVCMEPTVKPRSISSSRAGEMCAYPIPMYSEVYKPNRKPLQPQSSVDAVDNVICGSLHIKPSQDNANSFVEIRNKDFNKSNSMPNQYHRRSGEIPTTPNKYDEYVAEKREQHHKPIFNPPTPPQRKLSIPSSPQPPIYFPRKKPANLEEAINELEAIYKSLGLTEEPDKKERIPTPSEFEKFALAHADEYEDEDSSTGEPDPVRDDVAYRNIQLANLQHKTAEKQPPFGIPIGPVVPSPQTDYLHVVPNVESNKITNSPDIIKDDLAVRALRKDPPGPKEKFIYPTGSLQKKNRATRTQSANIYSLIQRDAAKPSGGDFLSYMELTKSIDRSGSMSDLHRGDSASDIPATLTLLRNLKEQDHQQGSPTAKKGQIPFRHPSQGGAICQLPEKLTSPKEETPKHPVPLPRKSLTPEPTHANYQMEDALNKIAKDAQESSVKLTKELQELRKEALITASRPKINLDEEKLEKELQEIEAVSVAAKRCGKMLLENLPDANEPQNNVKPRKLHKEVNLIQAIDQVSEAANAVCEKILKDIVTTEPPVVVHEAIQVKNRPKLEPLVMPNLIKKLDPIQSEKIEKIADRCMRQLSELADTPDYDNLAEPELKPAGTAAVACNTTYAVDVGMAQKVDSIISTIAEASKVKSQQLAATKNEQIEEIDKIMQECEAQVRSSQSGGDGGGGGGGVDTSTITETPSAADSHTHLLVSRTDDRTTAPSMSNSSSSSKAGGRPAATAGNAAAATNSSTTASSFSSSSDCLAKSSSPSASRRQSSSITSFNPYSSSDYIKSPSSEYHAPSTDPIKTFSTTSYDVQSTSATPNITTNSTFSYSPSPPLNLTPKSGRARTSSATAAAAATDAVIEGERSRGSTEERARSSSPSQYNSSEELAMIFGISEETKSQKQQRRKQQQQQLSPTSSPSLLNVSGNGQNTQNIHHEPNVQPKPQPFAKSSSIPNNNHASSLLLFAKPDQTTQNIITTTNPNAACQTKDNNYVVVGNNVATINPACCLNVVDFIATISTTTTSTTTTNTNTAFITTTNNNSPTNVSCKLETIPETPLTEQEQEHQPNNMASVKLSPNFNKIYASKISIVVNRAKVSEEPVSNLSQFDSLSSLEETSSNPDSGNVSLADFPLAGNSNACLQLQTAYNSRFEVRKTFVSEVSIKDGEKAEELEATEDAVKAAEEEFVIMPDKVVVETNMPDEEFPPLPTEEELMQGLKYLELDDGKVENSVGKVNGFDDFNEADLISSSMAEEYVSFRRELNDSNNDLDDTTSDDASPLLLGTPVRKRSIVYETPQINMNISEVKVTYEIDDDDKSIPNIECEQNIVKEAAKDDVLSQITQCTAEVERLSDALDQMPTRRHRQRTPVVNHDMEANTERSLLPLRQAYRQRPEGSRYDHDEKSYPTAPTSAMSLFGEMRPTTANSLTTLEHVVVACSLGVISPHDIFTMFLIIIGMITIIAIVLF